MFSTVCISQPASVARFRSQEGRFAVLAHTAVFRRFLPPVSSHQSNTSLFFHAWRLVGGICRQGNCAQLAFVLSLISNREVGSQSDGALARAPSFMPQYLHLSRHVVVCFSATRSAPSLACGARKSLLQQRTVPLPSTRLP